MLSAINTDIVELFTQLNTFVISSRKIKVKERIYFVPHIKNTTRVFSKYLSETV